jgi:Undecaprenyl-phosphate glucose phosphotransferase
MALDSVVIVAVALITYLVFVGNQADEPTYYAAAIGFVWLVCISLMNFASLYGLDPAMRPLAFADKIIISFATTFLFLLAAAFAVKLSDSFSRTWIAAFAVSSCSATILARYMAGVCLGLLAERRLFTRRIAIVGSNEQAKRLMDYIDRSDPSFISVLGVFSVDATPSKETERWKYLGNLDVLPRYVWANGVDDIIVALPWSQDEKIMGVVSRLRELPVNVYLASDLIGFRLPFRQSPDHFGEVPVVEVMGQPLPGWGGIKKRILDCALTIATLPVVLPIMAIVALAIKLEDGGPIFFRQARYGFGNEIFWIWKFRTMRHEDSDPERTVQAVPGDARVTRVGRILRRTSLDELPQLFNVLVGTMSLVGPRPHAVDHNEEYSRLIRGYFARHRVKPGITGWAQVNGHRGATSAVEQMEARVKHDIYYTDNWSLLFDLKILAMTIAVSVGGRNAY